MEVSSRAPPRQPPPWTSPRAFDHGPRKHLEAPSASVDQGPASSFVLSGKLEGGQCRPRKLGLGKIFEVVSPASRQLPPSRLLQSPRASTGRQADSLGAG